MKSNNSHCYLLYYGVAYKIFLRVEAEFIEQRLISIFIFATFVMGVRGSSGMDYFNADCSLLLTVSDSSHHGSSCKGIPAENWEKQWNYKSIMHFADLLLCFSLVDLFWRLPLLKWIGCVLLARVVLRPFGTPVATLLGFILVTAVFSMFLQLYCHGCRCWPFFGSLKTPADGKEKLVLAGYSGLLMWAVWLLLLGTPLNAIASIWMTLKVWIWT